MALRLDPTPGAFGTVWVRNVGTETDLDLDATVDGPGRPLIIGGRFVTPGERKLVAQLDDTPATVIALADGAEVVAVTYLVLGADRRHRGRTGGRGWSGRRYGSPW